MRSPLLPYQIKGNQTAKRAFEVASVGGLSVLLVGPLSCSKTTLREAFPTVQSAEREACLCGHRMDVRQECICTPVQIARWWRRLERTAREYDIVLEMPGTPTKELMAPLQYSECDDDYREERIASAAVFGLTHTSVELRDDSAHRTMEMACRRMAFSAGQYGRVLKVARAVANLGGAPYLETKHVAEACQYQSLLAMYSRDVLPLVAGIAAGASR
jgi:predicted ATPase with chaperone activity